MTTPAIEILGRTKSYGEHHVLRGVDLRVTAGTVVALLGSNGAGTTTAVRILSTLLRPDGGTASVDGSDVVTSAAQVRASMSLTGHSAPSTSGSPGGRTSRSSRRCGTSTMREVSRTTCSRGST